MLQNLFDCYPFLRVEFKHPTNEVQTTRMDLAAKELRFIQLLSGGYELHCLTEIAGDLLELGSCGRSSPSDHFLYLVDS